MRAVPIVLLAAGGARAGSRGLPPGGPPPRGGKKAPGGAPSAARLVKALKGAGFKVRVGVSGMPTAFVAEYGSGRPVIGILAEYDALPELSQEAGPVRKAVPGRGAGHGCGHCALGTAAVGAGLGLRGGGGKHGAEGA